MERCLSKDDNIEFKGIVTDLLPESRCMVQLENGHKVLCYTAGKLKKFKIRMLVGDKVTVEMTPYDLTKGRITYRGKKHGEHFISRDQCHCTDRIININIFCVW